MREKLKNLDALQYIDAKIVVIYFFVSSCRTSNNVGDLEIFGDLSDLLCGDPFRDKLGEYWVLSTIELCFVVML